MHALESSDMNVDQTTPASSPTYYYLLFCTIHSAQHLTTREDAVLDGEGFFHEELAHEWKSDCTTSRGVDSVSAVLDS